MSIGDIPPTERDRLTELLHSNQQVFAQNESDVGLTDTFKHRICTTEDSPVRAAYRHIPPPQFEEVNVHINDLIQVPGVSGDLRRIEQHIALRSWNC